MPNYSVSSDNNNILIMAKKLTLIDFVEKHVDRFPNNTFLWEKVGDEWTQTTYTQTKKEAYRVGAGLMAIGFEKGEKVAYLSEGRNLWVIGEIGVLYAGGVSVPLSVKLEEANDLLFRVKHSDSTYVFTSESQLPKIRAILPDTPLIKKVIVFDKIKDFRENEMYIGDLMELGDKYLAKNEKLFKERAKSVGPDDYANISYTSGTTADPKGILLTHRNYTANVEQSHSVISCVESDRMLIILPLDHCFAHVAGFYTLMSYGSSFATVPGNSLRNIPSTIQEIKPTLMLSVPSLAKNFKKSIEGAIAKKSGLVQWLYKTALNNAIKYNKEGYNKGTGGTFWRKPLVALFDKLVFKSVRKALGGEMRFFVGGGALLDIDLQRYYYAIGIPMFQGYGLSEATPIISANSLEGHILGSSGRVVKPMEIKIINDEGKEQPYGGLGEICIKGENVMAGYWKNPKSTAETVVDGWLHTGDMGYMRDAEYLYVVGRFKSLLIASDGEKYSPELIEESIAENSQYISNLVLYNNQNPYTIAFIVPNVDALKAYVTAKKPSLDLESQEAKELMLNKIQAEIDSYRKGGANYGAFPERWLPAALCVLPEPFTEKNRMMNSSLKVVRRVVEEVYADRMEYAYTPEGKNVVNEMNLKSL